MKKLFFIITLGVSITAMGCSSEEQQTSPVNDSTTVQESSSERINEDVSVDKFAELIAKEDGQILDVRTPAEWESGTIKGATKMNFFDKDFKTQLEKLDKTKPVYVYCKAGGRSGKAAKQMKEMGFTAVYNLLGGMGAWSAAGKEVIK